MTHTHTYTHLAELGLGKMTSFSCVNVMPNMLAAHRSLLERHGGGGGRGGGGGGVGKMGAQDRMKKREGGRGAEVC